MKAQRSLKSELIVSFISVVLITLVSVESISYWRIRDVINLRVSESTVETLKQIDKNLTAALGDIQDISLYTISNRYVRAFLKLEGVDRKREAELLIAINEEYANLLSSKDYIASINIYGANGLRFETAPASSASRADPSADIEKRLPADGMYVLTPTYKRSYQTLGGQYVISFYRQINDINNLREKLGILRIDISEKRIGEIYSDIRLGSTGYVFIADKSGNVVSHPNKNELSTYIGDRRYFSRIFTAPEGFYRTAINGVDSLVTYYASKKYDFYFIGIVPVRELVTELGAVRAIIVLATLLAAALAFAVFYALSSGITRPVNALTALMKKVEDGDLNVAADMRRKDEIGQLGKSFNSMVRTIKHLIEEVYENQIRSKEAELRALQAQINPHFLYNTLDVIYWTSRLENAPKTGEIVGELAKLFKLGLNNGREITTIGKEVEHMNSYLAIQRFRYDRAPRIRVAIDEKIYPFTAVKLILQPIVENAFVHGIPHLGEEGTVEITGRESDGDIVFEVTDNGCGMSEKRLGEIFLESADEKKGYGIKNVHERIRMLYGPPYGLLIRSGEGRGTTVVIRIPKR